MRNVPRYRATFAKKSAQSGFIQAALLFGIALMTAVLGGFALANRSPTSQTDVEQAKVNASVILKQASDLRDGVARYSSDFGSSAVTTAMTFESVGNNGLFNASARYASPQIMPTSTFDISIGATVDDIKAPAALVAGHWYLNRTTAGNGLAGAGEDPMVVLPGLRADVCGRVNTLLYGANTIPVGTGALSAWTTNVDGGISAVAGVAGWPEGCIQTSDSRYVYFKTVQEN
ncbi:hypothetical protein [Limnobacter sp.]|uniref:hypothetical protein n=1 Tax=Limnobacter sp. TaxID=2003368 RepID=UPI0027374C6B|nr:hypothetical protein [Limnobacter sp.]MDP3188809.1 hypothetical protein [Limnobacter sp.]